MNKKYSIFNDHKIYYFTSLILLVYMIYIAYMSIFIIFIPMIFKFIFSIFTLFLIEPNFTKEEMNFLNYGVIFTITYFSIIIGIPLSFLFIFIKKLRKKAIKMVIIISTLIFLSVILINLKILQLYITYICILALSSKALSIINKQQKHVLIDNKI